MTKSQVSLLEKCFTSEIKSALDESTEIFVVQGVGKDWDKLEALGMIERRTQKLTDRLGAFTVSGWALTTLGHMSYCQRCGD